MPVETIMVKVMEVPVEALEQMRNAALRGGGGTSNSDAVRFAAMQYLRLTGVLAEPAEQPQAVQQ